jgi:hypothetical protein
MNGPEWAFPVVESLNFIGFAFSIERSPLLISASLIGDAPSVGCRAGCGSQSVDISGFALMLITGPLMFSADVVRYHDNPSFQFKMICLLVALLFHFTIHRKVTRSGDLRLRPNLLAGCRSRCGPQCGGRADDRLRLKGRKCNVGGFASGWIESMTSVPSFAKARSRIRLLAVFCSIALFGGMPVMTDLRLLGLAMQLRPVSEVMLQFRCGSAPAS